MLTLRQIDDSTIPVQEIIGGHEQDMINAGSMRIKGLLEAYGTQGYNDAYLSAVTAQSDYTRLKLQETLNELDGAYVIILSESLGRSMATDNAIYRDAKMDGATITSQVEQIAQAVFDQTFGEFTNLSRTTAYYSNIQFGKAVDAAIQRILDGMSYQEALRMGMRELTQQGIESIRYPSGRRMFMDSAFRLASLTGVNQLALRVSIENAHALNTNIFETSSHVGARTSPETGPSNHAWWQGRRFMDPGASEEYPNLITETGYGTGEGLGGYNCRHSLFPVPDPSAPLGRTQSQLREINNNTVIYNGQKWPIDKATDYQRYLERGVRSWKRQRDAAKHIGDTEEADRANGYVSKWQARLIDFVSQTGLRRDYFRERAGAQLQ